MNAQHWSGNESLSVSVAQRVDAACRRFEKAWQEGRRPHLEDYLADMPAAERLVLLRELVPLDAAFRLQAGEQPSPEDYAARFPELNRDWLARALALRPDSKPAPDVPSAPRTRRLRCPHCHNPIDLADRRSETVLCPGCGSSFHVHDAHQTSTTQPMRQVGKFQLLARVGLGAFGAVWKARDTELDRVVALKIPHTGLLTEGEQLERFRREARAAAQLRHPHIVTVHEVVELDGLPAIVSDFIEGVPLKELIEGKRLTFHAAAALLVEVAEAVDYAHGMGLVHRDLKPANILVEFGRPRLGAIGDADEVQGRPLVMDFGLALRQEAEITMTQDGVILGTPAYMSPEQAAGYSHQADARSDVYSLGVIFYELLTGELPFRGSKAMLLHQVLREEPRPPRKINDKVPRDLETICLKALAKAPARRYANARELAEDLRRWQKGEPIQARPVGRLERTARWVRRNPVVSGLLAAVIVVLLTGTGVSVYFAIAAAGEAEQASKSRAATEAANIKLEAANQGMGQSRNDLEEALARREETLARSLLRPVGLQPQVPLTDPEIDALWELAENRVERVWKLFIKDAIRGPVTTRQLRHRAAYALHAAVGLEPIKREQAEQLLAARLQAPEIPESQRIDLAVALVALGELSAKMNDDIARILGQALVENKLNFLDSNGDQLVAGLVALAGHLEPKEATRMANAFTQAMTKATDKLSSVYLAKGLAAAVGRLEPKAASAHCAAAANFITRPTTGVLEVRAPHLSAYAALSQAPAPINLGKVAPDLAAVVAHMEPREAARLADTLTQSMKVNEPGKLEDLAKDVATLASRLEPKAASAHCAAAANIITQVMIAGRPVNPVKLGQLASGLAAVAAHLEPEEATRLADSLTQAISKTTEPIEPISLGYLAQSLAAVADRLKPEEAAAHCATAAAVLTRIISKTQGYPLAFLVRSLAMVASRLEPKEAAAHCAAAADALTQAMSKTGEPSELVNLAEGLAAVADFLERKDAARCAAASDRLTQAMSKTNKPFELVHLAEMLAVMTARLAPKLEAKEVAARCAAAADGLTRAMSETNDPGVAILSAVGLATVADLLEPNEAIARHAAAAAALIQVMPQASSLAYREILPTLEATLTAVLVRVDPSEFSRRSGALAATLGLVASGSQFAAIFPHLRTLAAPLPCRFSTQELVELLKQPTCVGPARRVILDQLENRYGRRFADQWAFVHFAQEQGLGLDFTSPPKRFSLGK